MEPATRCCRAMSSDLQEVRGDHEVDLDEFLRTIAEDLLAYFLRRLRPAEDAADCVSETLLVIWRRRTDLPTAEDQRRAWAYGVARHVLMSYRRAGFRREQLATRLREDLATQYNTPDSSHEPATKALATLSLSDREIIELVLWEGLSHIEVAAVLGIRPATARARYSRARHRLERAFLNFQPTDTSR